MLPGHPLAASLLCGWIGVIHPRERERDPSSRLSRTQHQEVRDTSKALVEHTAMETSAHTQAILRSRRVPTHLCAGLFQVSDAVRRYCAGGPAEEGRTATFQRSQLANNASPLPTPWHPRPGPAVAPSPGGPGTPQRRACAGRRPRAGARARPGRAESANCSQTWPG